MKFDLSYPRTAGLSRRLFFLLLLGATGCTARGYPGPGRSAEEISAVSIARSGEIVFDQIIFDDKQLPFFGDVVELLPGEHTFRVNFRATYDAVGCDSARYSCPSITAEGICEGTVRTRAGRTYLLWIENKNSMVDGRISAKGYFDFFIREDEPDPGRAYCRTLREY